MQEQDLVAQPLRLPQVVRHHDDLGALGMHRRDDAFDFVRRAGIEIGGRLVEKKNLRPQRPGARQREALLLAARKHARGALGERFEAHRAQRLAGPRLALRRDPIEPP